MSCLPIIVNLIFNISQAVEMLLVDKAVLPIENSIGGSIYSHYDLLLSHKLNIVGEVKLQINHCLLGLSGVTMQEIVSVMSHPQVSDHFVSFSLSFFLEFCCEGECNVPVLYERHEC